MNLEERITLLENLGAYLASGDKELAAVIQKASEKNKWFTEEFIHLSIKNIVAGYLDPQKIKTWTDHYHIDNNITPVKVGVVMAGNIPLVGFHDFLCVFLSGHFQYIKLSEKDDVLLKHLVDKLTGWNPKVSNIVTIAELLKNCDAYIATGSNNSSRYFNYYFGRYPHLIRSNKTSVAILTGEETTEELSLLADDVFTYFGLGCRNVTKIFVPERYDFEGLLQAFGKYHYFSDIAKYKNNYDYNLALLIMNNKKYMSNENVILVEEESVFSAVSELHYSFYTEEEELRATLSTQPDIQCIVGRQAIPFGQAQSPVLFDYADGVDTMQFLLGL